MYLPFLMWEFDFTDMDMMKKKWITPPRVITASFAAMILVGALLLCLPIASKDGQNVHFIDALFTATSANCVTGLVVLNTAEQWTVFGKIIILVLIQAGGLGFITFFTTAMILLRRQIPLSGRVMIQASFNLGKIGGMVKLVNTTPSAKQVSVSNEIRLVPNL